MIFIQSNGDISMVYSGIKKTALASVLFFSIAYSMEIKSLAQAVDVAGKQRMYSQKLLKDYVMIGMKN